MAHYARTGGLSNRTSGIRRPIVHYENFRLRIKRAQLGKDVAERVGFVKGGDENRKSFG